MKFSLLTFFILIINLNSFSQKNNDSKYKCPCEQIGLDTASTKKNNIACYLIPVLKDISKTAGSTLLLAVVIVPSLTKTNEAPLLYLHGGPGIATVENVPKYIETKTWKLLREKRSLIFFDYRGTGFSEPSFCPGLDDSVKAFSKSNATGKEKKLHEASLYKKCREQLLQNGTDLSTFSSLQFAADADAIRKHLNIKTWSIYGVSYGTTVALNMLRRDGTHVRAVILDSPFPPNAPWVDFVHPFDTCFKVLEKNIAANSITAAQFLSIRNDFVTAVKRLNKKPATIKDSASAESYDFNGDDFAWSIWDAMLKPRAIPFVPLAIHEIANGNDSILSAWVSAFSSPNSFGKFSIEQSRAILCYEGRARSTAESSASLLEHYPDFASFIDPVDEDICQAWRPDTANRKIFDAVTSDVPVLILSGEYDPVCPPLFGAIAARTLSNASFIIVPSASHAAIHADDCVRETANAFLLTAVKPGITCISKRQQINFVTGNLDMALSAFKK